MGNLYGMMAIVLWSLSALIGFHLKHCPTLGIIALSFIGMTFYTCIYLLNKKNWHILRQPISIYVAGLSGTLLSDIMYLLSFKYAPAAHIDLINYTWPTWMVLGLACMEKKINSKVLAAVVIGFLGIGYMITEGYQHALSAHYLYGYGFVLIGTFGWAYYSIFFSKHSIPMPLIAVFGSITCIISLGMHWYYEPHYFINNTEDIPWIIIMALFTQGCAYILWNLGLKHGSPQHLSVLSYFSPILSIIWLVIWQITASTTYLWTALICVTVSTYIAFKKEHHQEDKGISSMT